MANRFSGRQGKGSKRVDRLDKRREAESRNALTVPERRKAYRKGKVNA